MGVTFGERLRQLRLEAGLSQIELAGDGLSASYISLLESGKRTPSDEVINTMARRLGCSTTQLRDGKPSDREERISLEIAFARLAIGHGDPNEARSRLQKLLAEDDLPPRIRADATQLYAKACSTTGDFRQGIKVLTPYFERACQGQGSLLVHEVGLLLCGLYLDSTPPALGRAIDVGVTALAAAKRQGLGQTDEYFRLAATVMSAWIERGDLLHAQVWAETLLEEAETAGQTTGQAVLYWNLAYLAERQGRVTEALTLAERAMARMGDQGSSRDQARLRNFVAITLLNCDPPQHERAISVLESNAGTLTDHGSSDDQAEWHCAMSVALLHRGDVAGAESQARMAYERARDSAAFQADALHALSDALEAQGRDEEAADTRRAAFNAMEGVPAVRSTALTLRELAERIVADDPRAAMGVFRQALDAAGIRDRSAALRERVAALRELASRTPITVDQE